MERLFSHSPSISPDPRSIQCRAAADSLGLAIREVAAIPEKRRLDRPGSDTGPAAGTAPSFTKRTDARILACSLTRNAVTLFCMVPALGRSATNSS